MTDEADEVDIVETAPAADAAGDVIPGHAPRPPRLWSVRLSGLAAVLAVVLLAGIGIGYLIGHAHRGGKPVAAATSPRPAGSVLAELPALAVDTTCVGYAAAGGNPLMVGVEIVNNSSRWVALNDVRGSFPLGGLHQVGSQIGQCDNNATEAVSGHRIAPTAVVWVSLTLQVQVGCPAPLPVRFDIDYTVDGAPATQTLNPFPDLGNVPYPGCPTR